MRAEAGGWRCGVRNSKRRGVLEEPGSRAVGAGPPPARLPERPHPPSAYRGETGGLPGARRALCPPAPPRCPWAAPGRRSGGNANTGSLPPALSHPLAAPHTHLGARPRQLPPRAGPGRAAPPSRRCRGRCGGAGLASSPQRRRPVAPSPPRHRPAPGAGPAAQGRARRGARGCWAPSRPPPLCPQLALPGHCCPWVCSPGCTTEWMVFLALPAPRAGPRLYTLPGTLSGWGASWG